MSLRNAKTKLVLASHEDKVYTETPNRAAKQNWDLIRHDDGTFEIVNQVTRRVLDSNHDGEVYTLDPNYGDFQRWRITNKSITNVATGRALASNSEGQVYTRPFVANKQSQLWSSVLDKSEKLPAIPGQRHPDAPNIINVYVFNQVNNNINIIDSDSD